MTAALLALAAAVAAWPRATAAADRLAGARFPGEPGRRRTRLRPARPPRPAVVVALVTAAAALVAPPVVAVLAGAGAGGAARAVLRRQADRAAEHRLAALAEALGALSAELRAGRPLEAATASAVALCADAGSGRALATAVRSPGTAAAPPGGASRSAGGAERRATGPPAGEEPPRAALERIAAAVALSVRTGCSLAAVLAAVEDDLRARRRLTGELRAATAGARASAAVLAGLPLLGLAMGSGIGADPWGVLTGTVTGQILLLAGAGLEAVGLAWTARLVRRALR
ncbi:type II secretion system F family protein [Geodermatophilus marinus]|uniref:type II secretion system F family protein n=1 Tax=Geodermatophilus sp. LHW52908 TaxID=2303986 RepID=UPI000E3E78C5|nr:pilus assembly protein TadB [Geodermatophilus sp. LHW52908]RFU22227.1 pilus assembly protein TadB [Geodermatophilus sp. LHW52908]